MASQPAGKTKSCYVCASEEHAAAFDDGSIGLFHEPFYNLALHGSLAAPLVGTGCCVVMTVATYPRSPSELFA